MSEATLIDRYQSYRTRRFLKHESTYAHSLPAWRTRRRRRLLVAVLGASIVSMSAVSALCAFGIRWAPLLWIPACLVYLPAWFTLQIVSGRQGDAPLGALDEYELAQRNSARSIGLTVTQCLMFIPIGYLLIGSTVTGGTDVDMAYAGGLMVTTVLIVGACTPAMILSWTRPDPDA